MRLHLPLPCFCIALITAGCTAEATVTSSHVASAHDAPSVATAPRVEASEEPAEPTVRLVEGRPARPPRTTTRDLFAATVEVSSKSTSKIGSCLGVMVAPRLALTAGHCINKDRTLTVRAVTTSGSAVEVERYWIDPEANWAKNTVDTSSSDIAILLLAKPIHVPFYPSYARGSLGREVDAIGIRNAPNALESVPITLSPTSAPRYYSSEPFTKRGDSGGPVFVVRGDEHVVAGVLSGGSKDDSIFARVDLVSKALDDLVASTASPNGTPQAKSDQSNQKKKARR